jgi:hypothetical protein
MAKLTIIAAFAQENRFDTPRGANTGAAVFAVTDSRRVFVLPMRFRYRETFTNRDGQRVKGAHTVAAGIAKAGKLDPANWVEVDPLTLMVPGMKIVATKGGKDIPGQGTGREFRTDSIGEPQFAYEAYPTEVVEDDAELDIAI